MNTTVLKFQVDGEQMTNYLKDRFKYEAITALLFLIVMFSLFAIIPINGEQDLDGLWSFLFSFPLAATAIFLGIKRWNNKLRELSFTEFIVTNKSLIQKSVKQEEKEFDFSEIVVVNRKKFGTTLIKGNILTKIEYGMYGKKSFGLDSPKMIFIPSITTNYTELIDTILQGCRKL